MVSSDRSTSDQTTFSAQGESVQPTADLGDGAELAPIEIFAAARLTGSFDEQLHGRVRRIDGRVRRHRQRAERNHPLVAQAERLAARREELERRALAHEDRHDVGGRDPHVFAVVEHEQGLGFCVSGDDAVEQGLVPLTADSERRCERVDDRLLARDLGQLAEPDAVAVAAAQSGCDLQSERGLADAGGADQGRHSAGHEQLAHSSHL